MLPERRRSRRDAGAAAAAGDARRRRCRSTSGWASGCRRCAGSTTRRTTRGSRLTRARCRRTTASPFFKLMTGALRVGVAGRRSCKALAEATGVDETHDGAAPDGLHAGRPRRRRRGFRRADRAIAPRAPAPDDGQPYPFFLAHPERGRRRIAGRARAAEDWIAEWKFDGIRAQLLKRGAGWRLWSRGEELISESYPDLAALADALPDGVALDGEIVVMRRRRRPAAMLEGLAPFAELQQRLGRKIVTREDARASCRSCSSPTICSNSAGATCARCRSTSAAPSSRGLVAVACARKRLPLRLSPASGRRTGRRSRVAARSRARARRRRPDAEGARGAYGVGRRKGGDRTDVWWKWKLDPMSVDAVLIYAQRGHGRRSGVYSDYTFARLERPRTDRARRSCPSRKPIPA